MGISDRIEGSIEKWSGKWSGRLAGWFIDWTSNALMKFLEVIEPEAVANVDEILADLAGNEAIPQSIRNLVNRARGARQPIQFLILIAVAVLLFVPMILGLFQPLQRIINYGQERIFKSGRMDWVTAITAWRRGFMPEDRLNDTLRDHGFDDLDIQALKNVSLFYPGAQDLVTWQAREVFEPDMIERYGLDAELEGIVRDAFYKAGINDEQIVNYWRAHWQHASFLQVVEMLRRGLIEEEDVYDWYRLVEIPPYWRDKLTAISWEIPTRVDVRRWWDMRTIDEDRLRQIYRAQGYHDEDLEDYVLWTKVYTDFPVLMSRWSNGWITEADVRAELARLGMPADRIDTMIQEKVQNTAAERTSNERDLTKTDIYKGVKQNRITRSEAADLLQDLGYSEDEADYLLAINIPEDEQDDVADARLLTKTEIRDALDAGELTEEGAIERLQALRYSLADAQLMLKIWTYRYRELVKGDILAAFNRGTMDKGTAAGRLEELGYSSADAEILLDRKEDTPEELRLKEASKADIVKGVKNGVITPEEGYTMLTDIGYSPEAADFILEINPVSSPFSPINFTEFKELVTSWRRVAGREVPDMPERLKELADQVVKADEELQNLERSLKEYEAGISDEASLNAARRAELAARRQAVYNARTDFNALQVDYRSELARWQSGAGA